MDSIIRRIRQGVLAFIVSLVTFFGIASPAESADTHTASFAFCNENLTTYHRPMREVRGYDGYLRLVSEIAGKLPVLGRSLRNIESLDWYYFAKKQGKAKCQFVSNDSRNIPGMSNMGIRFEQAIQFDVRAGRIFVRGDVFDKQRDLERQLFNLAITFLCGNSHDQEADKKICASNVGSILADHRNYSTVEKLKMALAKKPKSLAERYVGISREAARAQIRVGENLLYQIADYEQAVVAAFADFERRRPEGCLDLQLIDKEFGLRCYKIDLLGDREPFIILYHDVKFTFNDIERTRRADRYGHFTGNEKFVVWDTEPDQYSGPGYILEVNKIYRSHIEENLARLRLDYFPRAAR